MRPVSSIIAACLIAGAVAGCAGEPVETTDQAGEAQTAGGPRDATAANVAAALLQQGVISSSEASLLVPLGTESGWTVMLTPGLPSSTQRLSMILVGQPGQPADSPIARWSVDQWQTYKDTAGQPYTVGGAPVLVFTLAQPTQLGNGTFAQAAARVGGVWLNNGGQNYRFVVPSPNALSWIGNLTVGQDGKICGIPGGSLFVGHDTSVTVETYPMLPNTTATLHYSADGYATIHDVPMDLAAVNAGQYGNNARWVASIPTAALSPQTTVAIWAEATSNGPGGVRWDSRNGQNYVAPMASAPQATWATLGTYGYFTSTSGWYYGFSGSLANPLSATPGDFQVYATNPSPGVEVYVPGITDSPAGAAACSAGFVRVEAWSPFFSGQPGGAWTAYRLPFVETIGNNCRFKWLIQYSDHTQAPPGVSFPANGDYPFDGDYPYKFRISTDGGATWQWLGTGGLPDGGANRTLHWIAPFHG
jgi:hypothetical protein